MSNNIIFSLLLGLLISLTTLAEPIKSNVDSSMMSEDNSEQRSKRVILPEGLSENTVTNKSQTLRFELIKIARIHLEEKKDLLTNQKTPNHKSVRLDEEIEILSWDELLISRGISPYVEIQNSNDLRFQNQLEHLTN
jgi:hypothetical protein